MIENSNWAKEIKEIFDTETYQLALEIASDPNLVVNIYQVNDLWIIEPRNILPDFWLYATFTKLQAYELCRSMEWFIR